MQTPSFIQNPTNISGVYARYKHFAYEVRLSENVSIEDAEKHRDLTDASADLYKALEDLINDLDFHKENIHGVNGSYARAKKAIKKANPNF